MLGPEDRWLCPACAVRLATSARPRTRTIGPGGAAALRVSYALNYGPVVSRLVTELKYGDKPGLAGLLASLMGCALSVPAPEDTVVLPVPIHSSRKRERGYNQSELLAARLVGTRGLLMRSDLLRKTRNTTSQTAVDKHARVTNVVGSFGVRRVGLLKGRRIVLIDDVVTTGSTIRECAKVVLKSGAREVSACVVASSL